MFAQHISALTGKVEWVEVTNGWYFEVAEWTADVRQHPKPQPQHCIACGM